MKASAISDAGQGGIAPCAALLSAAARLRGPWTLAALPAFALPMARFAAAFFTAAALDFPVLVFVDLIFVDLVFVVLAAMFPV